MRKTSVAILFALICTSVCFAYPSFNLRRCTPHKIEVVVPDGIAEPSEADLMIWPTVTRAFCSSRNRASAGKSCKTTRAGRVRISLYDVVCQDDDCGAEIVIPRITKSVKTRFCRS